MYRANSHTAIKYRSTFRRCTAPLLYHNLHSDPVGHSQRWLVILPQYMIPDHRMQCCYLTVCVPALIACLLINHPITHHKQAIIINWPVEKSSDNKPPAVSTHTQTHILYIGFHTQASHHLYYAKVCTHNNKKLYAYGGEGNHECVHEHKCMYVTLGHLFYPPFYLRKPFCINRLPAHSTAYCMVHLLLVLFNIVM